MESPRELSTMACLMVLQACWRDLQSLLSLPCFPSTYCLLLASAVGTAARNVSAARISFVDFIFSSPPRSIRKDLEHARTRKNEIVLACALVKHRRSWQA